ncbi:hypothetical protein H0H92_005367 [Tricholoma furcatifolium]|nr:hypothetical protein H0H92_005367 [Tricholoma furcatifolium]
MLIQGTLVTVPSLSVVSIQHDRLLAISPTGHITHNAPYTAPSSQHLISSSQDQVVTLPKGSFLLPAFVDLHLHAPQFLYQGTGLHLPLMQWLDAYAFRAEERIDGDPALARRVYTRLARRLLENGTGTVVLFGTIKEDTNLILAQVMHDAGVRAFVGKLSMDIDIAQRPSYVEPSADAALASARSFVQRCRALVSPTALSPPPVPVLTPRFVPTCSDALLAGLGALASSPDAPDPLYIQSHLAESHDQLAWVRRTRDGASDTAIFDSAALLTRRTVQAHCTYLPPEDLDTLAARGTAVAHCPLSNAYFSAGRSFGVREALERGVRVGLGTDVAGGYSADVGCAMRWAVGVARMREGEGEGGMERALDWKGALFLATRGGADALGIPVGTFEVGAEFDAQLIQLFDPTTGLGVGSLDFLDLEETDIREVQVDEEMVEKWWCIGDVRNRKGMWVKGRKVGSW